VVGRSLSAERSESGFHGPLAGWIEMLEARTRRLGLSWMESGFGRRAKIEGEGRRSKEKGEDRRRRGERREEREVAF